MSAWCGDGAWTAYGTGAARVGHSSRQLKQKDLPCSTPAVRWIALCGYATEGARALIRKGFADDDDLQRVVASTMVANTASRRVMEKAGLKLVRTFHQAWPERIEGDEQGNVEYALRRAEWETQESSSGRTC